MSILSENIKSNIEQWEDEKKSPSSPSEKRNSPTKTKENNQTSECNSNRNDSTSECANNQIDYLIFLTEKYRRKKKCCLFVKKKSLFESLKRYDIKCLNYEDRCEYYNNSRFAFNDGEILPNVIYKKMDLGRKNIYFPLESFLIKQVLYKIRSFIQICETLGAKLIKIKYSKIKKKGLNIKEDINIVTGSFQAELSKEEHQDNSISTTLKYDKSIYSSELFLCPQQFEKTIKKKNSHFLISEKDYNTDINLRYLVRSRLISNLNKYSTSFIMNQHSTIDFSLMGTLQGYGLTSKFNKNESSSLSINILVDFYDFDQIIGGENSPLNESGFKWIRRKYWKLREDNNNPDPISTAAFIRRLCERYDESDYKSETEEIYKNYSHKLILYEKYYGKEYFMEKCHNINYWIDIKIFLNVLRYFDPINYITFDKDGLIKIYNIADGLGKNEQIKYIKRFLYICAARKDLSKAFNKYIENLEKENKIDELLLFYDWNSVEALLKALEDKFEQDSITSEIFGIFSYLKEKFT